MDILVAKRNSKYTQVHIHVFIHIYSNFTLILWSVIIEYPVYKIIFKYFCNNFANYC